MSPRRSQQREGHWPLILAAGAKSLKNQLVGRETSRPGLGPSVPKCHVTYKVGAAGRDRKGGWNGGFAQFGNLAELERNGNTKVRKHTKDTRRRRIEKYKGSGTRFYFIPEYYDYSSVQKLIKENGIAEQIEIGASQGSDRIHEEYGIDALMALHDPKTIRNGVSLLPMSKTLEMAKKIVDLRTKITVDAINKAMGK
jgi:hypothetical protein